MGKGDKSVKMRRKDSQRKKKARAKRAKKEQRKIRDRKSQDRSIWFGLGMFGLVGWSIAIPTLIGIAVGLWIDRTFEHNYSCTLMSLFVGVVILNIRRLNLGAPFYAWDRFWKSCEENSWW